MASSFNKKPQDHSNNREFYDNLNKIGAVYHQVIENLLAHSNNFSNYFPSDPLNLSNAFLKATKELLDDPAIIINQTTELAKDYIALWDDITQQFLGTKTQQPLGKDNIRDNRFSSEDWQKNPLFYFIRQSYLLNSSWITALVKQLKNLDPKEARKVDFYTKLLVDAMAPTNFIMTNPEVLKETFKTGGNNLLKGMENLLKDLSHSEGQFKISTAANKAFAVGENLAITPGKVVFQNELMQLIQYQATTTEVYKMPLMIIPAWINKYYILDLQPKNSLVKWLVDNGISVFMVSWVNPDEKLSSKTFDDYMQQGILEPLKVIQEITKQPKINVAGYCLGGTLLACTIAYLKAKSPKTFPINCVTFLTTLIDFADTGDISVFIDDEQLQMLEDRMSQKGYLDGSSMAQTFSMIRANDMIWSFYINNYLMGKDPLPFDILYWNSDSTRLPAIMHIFYLRNMYQHNRLIKAGGINLKKVPIDLSKNDLPTYILATHNDHIVPWKSAYSATSLYKGQLRFTLSGSGHVAGVINHPNNNKYNHWTSNNIESSPDKWLAKAKDNAGSWWPDWLAWLTKLSGSKTKALPIDKKRIIEDAPGSYVKAIVTNAKSSPKK